MARTMLTLRITCNIERKDGLPLLPGELSDAMETLAKSKHLTGYTLDPPTYADGDNMYIQRKDTGMVTRLECQALVDLVTALLEECGLTATSLSYGSY